MKEIYPKIIELFQDDRFSVLATIIRQAGPTPRGVGTKCLIMEDGSFKGTIGGGIIEAKVIAGAAEVFDKGMPVRLSFTLDGSDVAETDMLCGGDVEVFLEPVSPKCINHLSIFEKAFHISNRGGAGFIATVISEDTWKWGDVPKIFVDKGGKRIGSLLSGQAVDDAVAQKMETILDSRQPSLLTLEDETGNPVDIFVEPLAAKPVLYVFGGGHVSEQIVPLAAHVDFQVVVIDDRQEYANQTKFPDAMKVHQFSFDGVMERLPVDESSYLVIVTRGHRQDKNVLAQALKTDAKYIGMIGSSRKRNIIFGKLMEEGFGKEEFSRVYSPIGLEIGAETPQEIAVSVVAELIKVRAGID